MGPAARVAVADLIKLLKDPESRVRASAAKALGELDAGSKEAVSELARLLADPDDSAKAAAAGALGNLGAAASDATPGLTRLLADPDEDVRGTAAVALGRINAVTKRTEPDLARLLKDPRPFVRQAAAYGLGKLGAAKDVAPDLVELLKDPDRHVRETAAYVLVQDGVASRITPELLKLLKGPDEEARRVAADVLNQASGVARAVVPELIALSKDHEPSVRQIASKLLGHLGTASRAAVPVLIALLNDPDQKIRVTAAYSLGELGAVARDADAEQLRSPEMYARTGTDIERKALGAAVKAAVPRLGEFLEERDEGVQQAAALALGRIGGPAKDAIPGLTKLLNHGNLRVTAVIALGSIAEGVSDRNQQDAAARLHLERALRTLESDSNPFFSPEEIRTKSIIERATKNLANLERASVLNRLSEWFQRVSFSDWKTWAVVIPLAWSAIVFALFLVKPLWLLRLNETLKDHFSVRIKPTNVEVSLGKPLGYVTLIRVLAYRNHVLDAWVEAHLGKCRENFEDLPTVKARMVHVPSPVKVDGRLLEFSPAILRAYGGKARYQCRWLIVGEGGGGKTSLACQIARWAMAEDKGQRLASHPMLPVLLEDELDDPAATAGLPRFTEAIRGKLQALVGSTEPISPELLTQLLRRWRILVIVDHFTEMSQATRDQIRFGTPEFPAAALVVTARTPDTLGNLPKQTVETVRLEANRLSIFFDLYFNERRKRDLFDDEEYLEACLHLRRMANERNITVLLAKLYADQLVAAKEGSSGDVLPKTIPDLMLRYLNELNRTETGEDNRTVQRDCKTIAWECLKTTYGPGHAERSAVIEAIRGDGSDERTAEGRLGYLVDHLRIVHVTGSAEDHIRFALDPLAEYLAGLHVVEQNRGTKRGWERFFEKADRTRAAPEAIQGFLLAVLDCCLASKVEVPEFVLHELSSRCGLDPALARRLKQK